MNNKLLVIVFGMLLLLGTAQGAYMDNLIARYPFTSNSDDALANGPNWTITGTVTFSTAGGATFGGAGNYLEYGNKYFTTNLSAFTFCILVNWTTSSSFKSLLNEMPTTENKGFVYMLDNPQNTYSLNVVGVAAIGDNKTSSTNDGTAFKAICNVFDGTTYRVYYQGDLLESYTGSTHILPDNACNARLNHWRCNYNSANIAGMKELCLWDRALSTAEIATYGTDGCGEDEVPVPSISLNSNLVNTAFYNLPDYEVSYNGTLANHNSDLFNCTLYNGTDVLNSSVNVNVTVNNGWTMETSGTGNYTSLFINCTNYEASDITTAVSFAYDTVDPVILTSFENGTEVMQNDLEHIWFNVSDYNLFAYEAVIYSSTGEIMRNVSALDLNDTFYENKTQLYTVSTGTYIVNITAWDSHTDRYVRDLDWSVEPGWMFAENFIISGDIKDVNKKGDPVTYFYRSGTDRYKFKITWNEDDVNHSVFLAKIDGLYYIEDSGYRGHFVDYDNKRWLDFESVDNIKSWAVTDYGTGWYIEFEHYTPTDEVEFESIGDLNVASMLRSYTVNDVSALNNALLTEISGILSGISDTVDDIYEVMKMFGWYILYLGLLGLGLKFIKKTLVLSGTVIGGLLGLYYLIEYGIYGDSLSLVHTGLGLFLVLINAVMFINTYMADYKGGEDN